MIDVMVAELSDQGRLRRGRTLAQQGAVGPLTVAPGMVSAVVQGSRPEPYLTTARVVLVAATGSRLASLVPSKREVRFSCSCPDDDLPCKHAIALMASFSERLAYDGSLFVRWRTGGEAMLDDPSGATTDAAPVTARFGEGERAALATFLGSDLAVVDVPTQLTLLPAPRAGWDEVWAEMLEAAIDVFRRPAPANTEAGTPLVYGTDTVPMAIRLRYHADIAPSPNPVTFT